MTDESEIWRTDGRWGTSSEKTAEVPLVRQRFSRPFEVAIILYGTMVFLLLANPQAFVDWLADLPQNAITEAARSAADRVVDVSSRLGLSIPYQAAREAFIRSGWMKRDRGRS